MNERFCMYYGAGELKKQVREDIERKLKEYVKATPDGKVLLSVSTKGGKVDFMEIKAVSR